MKKKLTYILLLCLPVLVAFQPLSLQNSSWTFEKETEGVKAYTRAKTGLDIREFRTECVIEATISSIVAVLKDAKVGHQWIANVEKVELLKQNGNLEWTTRAYLDLPWPISDRDIVTSSALKIDKAKQEVKIHITTNKTAAPVSDDYVRMPTSTGMWILTKLDSAVTKVNYEMFADPGGAIPSSIINPFIVDGPIENMIALRKMVKKPAYNSVRLDYVNFW